jgi:hypothetical protein
VAAQQVGLQPVERVGLDADLRERSEARVDAVDGLAAGRLAIDDGTGGSMRLRAASASATSAVPPRATAPMASSVSDDPSMNSMTTVHRITALAARK